METAQSQEQAASAAFPAFARFVLCGGGVGITSSFAVAALASWVPWALANALITVAGERLGASMRNRPGPRRPHTQ
ncbi:hypothetical protein ACFWJ5_42185 [Streptomyces qaidamensis]|uniref:hypothetical protein n=1 Tax=Streptomyces qaidamensis TaxID=1783515 RepID=UPI0036602F71